MPSINYMNQIELMHNTGEFNFNNFPFDSITKMIESNNYHHPILRFSMFYFNNLNFMKDNYFGCLNPLLITIMHGDSKLLNTILNLYGYPFEFSSELTPIEYSFQHKQLSCLESICRFLIRHKLVKKVCFKLDEFKVLLKSELNYCHTLISHILTIREDMRFPALAYIKNNIQIDAKKNLLKIILKMQKGGEPSIEEDFTVEITDLKQNEERKKKLENLKNENVKSEVDILTVPFKYNYSPGSEDSVRFLSYYSKSKSDAFVTSEWKRLIDQKWVSVKIFNFFLANYFFFFLIMSTIVIIFEERDSRICKFINCYDLIIYCT